MNGLNPYGFGENVSPGPNENELHQFAMDRARAKLEQTRAGHSLDKSAGKALGQLSSFLVLNVVLTLFFGFLAYGLSSKNLTASGIMTAIVVLLWGAFVLAFNASAPTSPKATITQFFKALGNGKFKRSRELTISADLDNTGRVMPYVEKLGAPSRAQHDFSVPMQYEGYWNGMLRDFSNPYCWVKIHGVKVNELRDDVVVVNFKARFMRNTRNYQLLFLLVGVLAFVIDAATRKTTKVELQKVLIRVGDEWKVFSGDWQGYDEVHHDWLLPVGSM
ncbi:MAG: hypothetical protein ACYTDT_05690 [Planctomycetota bacterium]|jgi:hypothetical protein